MDMLAAFDAAIRDGVDIISVSVGEGGFGNYAEDAVSIGAFHAMKNGIVTVAAAGNNGPAAGSVINHAPWILTVGASWTDRTFTSRVELGNGKSISVSLHIYCEINLGVRIHFYATYTLKCWVKKTKG